ncbi:hypothetical protein JQ557_30905 [Bradyrhizobium sp. U87765 SZCCT0131]|uniref:hypothetical protein n=1 Tax=unclassified Bradyrhizobium TaxID=2631580 RepID=UPI001BA5296A|nr:MULTISPECIES: hypothetical protein [unclassified Bradyrhizobium]MBR1222446.1 hypothetical protein [Bradyrhizobium sp. U87765 SZCCT0131]MBR1264070.1 hypothetical protein [Bradyrhizobium sp. U87765 SZCCT0134]MBR1308147.1 hypothetical protein [Bradyrhizobium sp. U87765 SZCCT0110]MBR1320320.1 hypothetical protein [Bradyrhizobium sp. U87765 SZCCT0109]MBR1348567.1 hypothetical protein [Bradyrhizobium sp. U87765 SZCCT0048]
MSIERSSAGVSEVFSSKGPASQRGWRQVEARRSGSNAKWPQLKTLIFLVYNSGDLRDSDELDKLGVMQEVAGLRFKVEVVLA